MESKLENLETKERELSEELVRRVKGYIPFEFDMMKVIDSRKFHHFYTSERTYANSSTLDELWNIQSKRVNVELEFLRERMKKESIDIEKSYSGPTETIKCLKSMRKKFIYATF